MLEQQDETTVIQELSHEADAGDKSDDTEVVNELMQLNAAFKTVQILGQIVRDFMGSTKGETKQDIVRRAFSLGLRALAFLHKMIGDNLPEIHKALVDDLTKRSQEEEPSKTTSKDTISEQVNRLLFGLMEYLTVSVIKHISESVGAERLSQTFAEVVNSDKNVSLRIIDLSIKLDYGRHIPKDDVFDLAKLFHKNLFAYSVIRDLVWLRFYLYPADYKIKQEVCDKLKISVENRIKLMNPGPKMK